jgi:cytochrome c oxidase assembly protein subunit 15
MDQSADRPVPRWLHVWAIVTVIDAAVLLLLGAFVTSFRVGMADPVWPTEPWYLANNFKVDFGYLVEHTHRIAGWLLAPLGTILTFGAWAYEPGRRLRWFGIAALIVLVVAFFAFQIALAKAPVGEEGLPVFATLAVAVGSVVLVLAAGYRAWAGGGLGGLIRAVVVLGMIAAMTQGLLGGVRVRYDQVAGRQLSAVHGVVGQIVFALLMAVAVLSAKPRRGPGIPTDAAQKLRWQSAALVLFTLAQIVWGAWIRHFPGPLSNRLHLLFAFVVVGFATLAIKQALSDPAARDRLKVPAYVLMGLIALQILLGVEAWVGKFLTGTLPEFERITAAKALLRTAHAHVGAWVLAVSVAFALAARRNPAGGIGPDGTPFLNSEVTLASEPVLAGR